MYDGHGSTRLMLDNNGVIQGTYGYDSYGNLEASSGGATSAYCYAGEQYDSHLDWYCLRARRYDPTSGRFNRIDPFTGDPYAPQSLHKYAYVHANPIMNIDPSGFSFSIAGLST